MKKTKLSNLKRFKSYTYFGAHLKDTSLHFRVWAPHAQAVSLVGDFNQWDINANGMSLLSDGIWETIIEKLEPGDLYKYAITQVDGNIVYKADPYAFYSEVTPKTASSFWSLDLYQWDDEKWLHDRQGKNILQSPMNIYEIHPGSWKRSEQGHFLTYRELADALIPYLLEMHYTHVELMGILEHPYDGSWGYQVSGYYAATSRYGSPEDFMYFIDACHQKGLAVILDWVPGHFCKDAHGLYQFDGKNQYEAGEHRQWGTMAFDYTKPEVLDFLISNAYFWFDQYHIDGLRVDGVASMIDLNHGLNDKPYQNKLGGSERLEAIAFLRELNSIIFKAFPFAIMVAEDSSAYPMVTESVAKGGLGFNFKWDLGWMHDTLDYMSTDPYFRHQFHQLLTFSMAYAFTENFILPLSHDEVVHGKKSILGKLFGDYDMKFAQFRLLYGYMMTHPGKKLSFMGNELAPFLEWKVDESLEWFMLEFEKHRESHHYIKALNKFYLREKALWINDHSQKGFKWLEADNQEESILIFSRMSDDMTDHLVIVINFLPMVYEEYPIGVPLTGSYRLAFNSDLPEYGGLGTKIKKTMKTKEDARHGEDQSITITIPPSSVIILKRIKPRKRT